MAGTGGKNRKFGRNKKSPAMKRAQAEHRIEKNKRRNIEREEQKQDVPKSMKVERGTARMARRHGKYWRSANHTEGAAIEQEKTKG